MASSSNTHKALTLKHVEGKPGVVYYPLQLQHVTTPSPSSSQLLLRPTHLSLNHRDLFLRQALYPSPSFTTPLFSDACCEVISTSSSPPRRVLLNPGHGWYGDPTAPEKAYAILGGTGTNPLGVAQEVIVVDEEETVRCPEHLSGAEAAALPLCGLTGWRALVTKSGAAEKGKNILITGIGGGVALMVLVFAVKMGINVWVSSGDEAKIQKAKELGAKGGINYKSKTWEKELKEMLPKERPLLDSIIDGAGGDVAERGWKLLKHGGTIVSYGMTVGPRISVPMSAVLKNIEIRGSTMGSLAEYRAMVAFVEKETVRPVVSRVIRSSWDGLVGEVETLFDDMKGAKQFGKLVVEIVEPGESKL